MNLFWIRKAGWLGTFPSHISSLLREDYSVTNKGMCYSVFLYRKIFHYKPARQYLNLSAPQICLDTIGQGCFLKNGTISQAKTLSWIKPQRAVDSHIWTPYFPFSPPLSGGHSVTFCWFPPMPHAPAHCRTYRQLPKPLLFSATGGHSFPLQNFLSAVCGQQGCRSNALGELFSQLPTSGAVLCVSEESHWEEAHLGVRASSRFVGQTGSRLE